MSHYTFKDEKRQPPIEIGELMISLRGFSTSRARLVGLAFVFLWFLIGGIAHFTAIDTEMRIVPPYIPHPRAVVIISGVFELLGAAGCCTRQRAVLQAPACSR